MAQRRKPLITRYRIFWTIIVVVFITVAYFLFTALTSYEIFTEINYKDVQIGKDTPNPDPQDIDKDIPIEGIEITNLDTAIQSADGNLVMHFWADKASKQGDTYLVEKGSLLFAMHERQTLLISLTDCTLIYAEKEQSEPGAEDETGEGPEMELTSVSVNGAISGHIIESSQYFEATGLEWDVAGNTVTTGGIRMIGGNLEVSGERMSYNLDTDEIIFEGQVDAQI